MNEDFHFYGTGTAAMAAGMNFVEAQIVANAAEFVDYFIGDYYWSYWRIVPNNSLWPKYLFTIDYPQLTAQSTIAAAINYYPDYWIAFHFPPGNKPPIRKQLFGEMAKLQERYLKKFLLREGNSSVKNIIQLCRPYSQFVIDMINDTIQTYQAIKSADWKKFVSKYIYPNSRYIGDEISKDTFALIFLGIRMHILADTWAHQDFTGFDDTSINHTNGDVFADVYIKGKLEKAPFLDVTEEIYEKFKDYITGGIIGGSIINSSNDLDNDIAYSPQSGSGHACLGHYPDYGWLNIDYSASWSKSNSNINRNNPEQYKEAWSELAAVIAICINNQSNISMPANVEKDIMQRYELSKKTISARLECEKHWANNSGKSISGAVRWKNKMCDPYIGVTHGLALSRWGSIWIQNGSILHMYELASLMHFSWCKSWTEKNTDYGWKISSIKPAEPNDINASGKWTKVPGKLKQISVGDFGIWGVNSSNEIWFRNGISKENSIGTDWNRIDGLLKQIAVGCYGVWGVNSYDEIWFRNGISKLKPMGDSWNRIDGLLKFISNGPCGVWGVNSYDQIWFRDGVSNEKPMGTGWTRVDGLLKQIAVGANGVWGVNSHDEIWFRNGILSENPKGTSWTRIDGLLKQITVGPYGVWGVNSHDEIWFRNGVSNERPMGTGWIRIDGLLKFISNGAYGIWGVNFSDEIWFRNKLDK